MKKITLALACVGLMSLTSCFKKERTCTCTHTDENGNATVSTIKFSKIKKSDAKDACSNESTSITFGGQTQTTKTDCELK